MYADSTMSEREHQPNLADEYLQPAFDLSERFIQRWDIQARQLENGRYISIRKPLETQHLVSHLKGDITLGTYVLDHDSNARFITFDADNDQSFSHLTKVAHQLQSENINPYLETSRRGGHLWLFFSQPVAGIHARQFGNGIITANNIRNIELFPKQDHLSGGPGSLIRLPFGFHQISGRRYPFITSGGERIAYSVREQIKILSDPKPVPVGVFEAYRSLAYSHQMEAVFEPSEEPPIMLSDQIKQRISVLDFVSQYIDLQPTNQGAIGLCPFHDDHNPSFSVNASENYWQCFAGCGGGSIIDFWMKWEGCDFINALHELSELLEVFFST